MLKLRTWTNRSMCNDTDTNPASLFPSLDRPELSVDPTSNAPPGDYPDDANLAETFRHSGWRRNRRLIHESLKRTYQSRSRIDNFADCGVHAYVYKTVDQPISYRLGGSSCRDRFCVPCSIDRSRCLATNVLNELKDKPTRFVTLTLKQTNQRVGDVLDRLTACFRRLRSRKWWNRHVLGGCGFIEIKWSNKTQDWNVHLHLIVHGEYMPQAELSRQWYAITGDSHIVDIRFVKDNHRVGRYVTKYVSKPFNDTFANRPELLDCVVRATQGKRLCLTFGDWRGLKLTESPNEHDWISLGTFHDVVSRAVDGDRECLEAVREICKSNADAIMAAVKKARPPPTDKPPTDTQLFFQWPAIDARF